MNNIIIKNNSYVYKLDKHLDLVCAHETATVVKKCCTSRGESGYIECACGGVDMIICDNPDCTGITDEEANELLGKEI